MDLPAFHMKVRPILPTSTTKRRNTIGGDFGTSAHRVLDSRDGARVKIQLGFAQVSMNVATRVMDTIAQLLKENSRSISRHLIRLLKSNSSWFRRLVIFFLKD